MIEKRIQQRPEIDRWREQLKRKGKELSRAIANGFVKNPIEYSVMARVGDVTIRVCWDKGKDSNQL